MFVEYIIHLILRLAQWTSTMDLVQSCMKKVNKSGFTVTFKLDNIALIKQKAM